MTLTQSIEHRAPPPRGTPEWYLYKRAMRSDSARGGRLARFREIARRKRLTIEDVVAGEIEPVFVSEYRYYVWNVEPVLCVYCNERLSKTTKTRDHVIPRSRGGPSGDNLVPCCGPCNRAKADEPLLLFMARR
ncbi:MAG: HNH endonuclease [Myxococcales bacterium]|nr:HNH endonuclease [Myxococcales bacterium]